MDAQTKVFCGQCRHFAEKHLSSWDQGFEELCQVAKSPGTRVTYKGVEILPSLKPAVRNANNDCPDWEAKHGANERDVSGVVWGSKAAQETQKG